MQSAFKLIASRQFDVILCDIGLPDGSARADSRRAWQRPDRGNHQLHGYAVVSQAKQEWPIKAVAITGFGTDQDVRRCKAAGFDFHLVKPIDFHELEQVLDQVGA